MQRFAWRQLELMAQGLSEGDAYLRVEAEVAAAARRRADGTATGGDELLAPPPAAVVQMKDVQAEEEAVLRLSRSYVESLLARGARNGR